MRETTLQTVRGDTVFTVEIVGVFKMETRRGQKRDLTTWTLARNGVNFTLTFTKWTGVTTGMESGEEKDLHQTSSKVCLLIRANWD